jgi:hypothetical protein
LLSLGEEEIMVLCYLMQTKHIVLRKLQSSILALLQTAYLLSNFLLLLPERLILLHLCRFYKAATLDISVPSGDEAKSKSIAAATNELDRLFSKDDFGEMEVIGIAL